MQELSYLVAEIQIISSSKAGQSHINSPATTLNSQPKVMARLINLRFS